MKIIIVGAGEVGKHVSKMLSNDRQDIILMDESEEKLRNLDTNYDLMTRIGSGTSLKDLQLCGVKDADLFIAVTPYESVNMTACMLATNLGAKKTLARIDNYEYMLPKNMDFFKKVGINALIYPEMLAAIEIVQALERSWIREFRSFNNEALVLACVKVRKNATIVNKQFKSGIFNHNKYRIVALKRHADTIIPKGSDMIEPNDLVYFICPKENLNLVREEAGKKDFEIKNIIIMGGSRIAQKTVQYLPDSIKVKIIENDEKKCYELAEKLDTLIINGDGRNIDLLEEEDLQNTDAFIAVTGNSEANILACMVAQKFCVLKTVAEVENIDYIDLADNLDIGTLINKKLIAASHIYQQTLDDDALNVQMLTYSDAEIVEFVAKAGDKITKTRVRDLRLPDNVNIGGIIREGKGFIVDGNTIIQPDDHVVAFCMASSVRKLAGFF